MATKNITEERAARRFHQIAVLQRQLFLKRKEMADCKQHYKDLTEEADGLLARMMTAARDEGELPLFDLDSDD